MRRLIFALSLSSSAFALVKLPPQKPLLGKKKLSCIAVQWTNNQVVTPEKCHNMNAAVAEFYHRNSRGAVTLESFVGEVQTGIAGNASNVAYGEKMAMNKFPGADYYLLANTMATGANHSGNGVSHLIQIADNVAEHEIGHLLGLGHTTYVAGQPCCDKESIMNPDAKPSNLLSPPQYYYLAWMKNTEYSLWDGKQTSVTLRHPLAADGKLAMMIIPPEVMTKGGKQKYAYLSFPPNCESGKPCAALHLAATSPAGTQLIKEVPLGNTFYDDQYTGINIVTSAGSDATLANVQLSVK